FAQFGIIFRGKKRFERKAAEDFCVLPGLAYSCGEILLFHRIGNDDEMRRGTRGAFFSTAENKIAQAALKFSERRAMNGVNDDGNACAFGGETAKDSRLATVRMNDVGFLFAKSFFKL